jgi:single-stranded DNA-binding protein
LKFDSWDDKNGGGKRSKLSVVVDSFQFVGPPTDGDEQPQPTNRPAARKAPVPVEDDSPF